MYTDISVWLHYFVDHHENNRQQHQGSLKSSWFL